MHLTHLILSYHTLNSSMQCFNHSVVHVACVHPAYIHTTRLERLNLHNIKIVATTARINNGTYIAKMRSLGI